MKFWFLLTKTTYNRWALSNFLWALIFYSTLQRFQVFSCSKICRSFYFIIQQLRRAIRNHVDIVTNCYMDDIVTYLNNVGVYNWDKKMVEASLQDIITKILLINYLNVCLHSNWIVSIFLSQRIMFVLHIKISYLKKSLTQQQTQYCSLKYLSM